MFRYSLTKTTTLVATSLAGILAVATTAAAATAGLAVVVANSYDGYLSTSLSDANGIADTLEKNDFDVIRLLGATGGEIAADMAQIRKAAAKAGPVRLVYLSGFGMCVNDELVLFTDDLQPEQFKSGQIGDFILPVSQVADAVAEGASDTLVVFDSNPRQCDSDMVNAIKLPKNTALLITTGIGGDVVDEIDEKGMSAFATVFVEDFVGNRPMKDFVNDVIAQIRSLTEDQQKPILVGKP